MRRCNSDRLPGGSSRAHLSVACGEAPPGVARLRTDSATSLRALLQQGAGVSILDQLSAEAGLKSGVLSRLLPDWALPTGGVYAVFPPGRHVPAKVRAFIAFLRENLAGRV